MKDRFKFRIAEFSDKDHFIQFSYYEIGDSIWGTLCGHNSDPQMCTGMKDKNGKLIYEGDIVKIFRLGYTTVIQKTMIVKWYQNQSSFRLFDIEAPGGTPQKLIEKRAMGAVDSIEIVGNIYENEALLEEIID